MGITKDMFEGSFAECQMQEYFQMLNLDEKQARACNLFELIDVDGNGSIDLQELVDSCMRLSGGAKAVDVAMLSREVKTERKLAQKHREWIEKLLLEEVVRW